MCLNKWNISQKEKERRRGEEKNHATGDNEKKREREIEKKKKLGKTWSKTEKTNMMLQGFLSWVIGGDWWWLRKMWRTWAISRALRSLFHRSARFQVRWGNLSLLLLDEAWNNNIAYSTNIHEVKKLYRGGTKAKRMLFRTKT